MKQPCPIQSVRIIEVVEVKAAQGAGTHDDVCRIVTQYWSTTGELLATRNPVKGDVDLERSD